jgi:hypothetical protein
MGKASRTWRRRSDPLIVDREGVLADQHVGQRA